MDKYIKHPAPKIVKIKRVDGRVVQGCDVYIGRRYHRNGWNLEASKWNNPFKKADYGSAQTVVRLYEEYLLQHPELLAALPELEGKTLGCWCKPEPCHGDILIKHFKKMFSGKQ